MNIILDQLYRVTVETSENDHWAGLFYLDHQPRVAKQIEQRAKGAIRTDATAFHLPR